MQKLTSLVNSLYQEFFSGKGSLSLNPLFPHEERGEGWELFVEKGALQLRAEGSLSSVQALSFLARINPQEIEGYIRKVAPRYKTRVLKLPEGTKISDELLERVVKWGFNTLAVVGDLGESLQEYGLQRLHPLKVDLSAPYSRKLLAKEYLLECLNEAPPYTLLSLERPSCFEELHFGAAPTHRLTFLPSDEAWRKLRAPEFYPSNFLPTLALSKEQLSYFTCRRLSVFLEEMSGGPFEGAVVEIEEIPPVGSYGDLNLWAAGFSLLGAAEPSRLYEAWLARTEPELWNREALSLVEEISSRVKRGEQKNEKAKALADLALLESYLPFQKIAATLKVQFN